MFELLALVAACLTVTAIYAGELKLRERDLGRRLVPPGFESPMRRVVAATILAFGLWIVVFLPMIPSDEPIDFETLSPWLIFFAHGMSFIVLGLWCVLAGYDQEGSLLETLGLKAGDPWGEVGVGMRVGVVVWGLVLAASVVFGLVMMLFGGGEMVTGEPAPEIVWIAGLPIGFRILLSLSAGVVEEIFFRGFLQPRIGLWASTALFVMAHVGYGQLVLVFAVTLLSLVYGELTRRRGNVWAAVAAHALFDAVQLLIVIPWTLSSAGG